MKLEVSWFWSWVLICSRLLKAGGFRSLYISAVEDSFAANFIDGQSINSIFIAPRVWLSLNCLGTNISNYVVGCTVRLEIWSLAPYGTEFLAWWAVCCAAWCVPELKVWWFLVACSVISLIVFFLLLSTQVLRSLLSVREFTVKVGRDYVFISTSGITRHWSACCV